MPGPAKNLLRATVAAAAAALVLGGCADGTGDPDTSRATSTPSSTESSSESSSESPTEPSTQPSTQPPTRPDGDQASVPAILEFTSTTVSGDTFDGRSLAGRPTLLWFWAPWCPTCRGQIPQVEAIATEHGDDLNVVGIGSLDSAEAIAGFAEDAGPDVVTHLEDVDGELWTRFGVTEQSSFVLLDADGTVVLEAGYGGTDELDARVDDVVG